MKKREILKRELLNLKINSKCEVGLLSQQVKFPSIQHHLSGDKSRLGLLPQHVKFPSPGGRYKANRRSGARTCESVCEGAERVAGLGVSGNSNKQAVTKELPSPGGRGAGVRGVPVRGKHTTTKAFPSLVRTQPSKQSSELFARGKIGMGGSICHIKQPTTTLPIHGGRKVKSPRPQRFLVGEGRISMRKLSFRNSGEGTTYTITPPLVAKAAFTLAEVLITLAIIGVVAALTLPT
ncbi:type II secretion system protein, partial [bacterium]|nr:type II secretion system protein [bacterium]